MQNHFIIEMLGIKDNNVKVWDISQGSDALIVELYTEKRQQKCPFCRCKTKRVHSYRIQPIQGPVLPNQQVNYSFGNADICARIVVRPFTNDFKW
ncbi:hypothetical protein BN988_02093 [Oceanobacillus picturae]|uniref:Uncharacterized protein n=1 Tax=Oceanobacillus picturae TaxID=171693 RepID=W9AL27_9BACI|nr:hypothetical protein [Oceanobacillus picturae]CDO03577.1 hypothetical protein BN988_02093 [Oceanobacillus picturae]